MSSPSSIRIALLSGFVSMLCLVGGMLAGGVLGSIIFDTLPGHMGDETKTSLSAIAALVATFAGGALWGLSLARLNGLEHPRRTAIAGALSFGVGSILAGITLSAIEVGVVERFRGPAMPISTVFTLVFVPAAALVAGLGGLAIGLAQGKPGLAIRLAGVAGATGGLAFLITNRTMHLFGWVVGGPNAAQRATMIVTLLLSSLAAAFVANLAISLALRSRVPSPLPQAVEQPG